MSKNTHQEHKNKAKSAPLLEKLSSTPSDSSETSQYLLNFDDQSPPSTHLPLDQQEGIQHILREIAKAFRDAATEVVQEDNTGNQHRGRETNWVQVKTFHGTEEEDLVEWFEAFDRAANANN